MPGPSARIGVAGLALLTGATALAWVRHARPEPPDGLERIAHDLNNAHTVITGFSDVLHSSLPADDPRRGDVERIQSAARRANELTEGLLALAR